MDSQEELPYYYYRDDGIRVWEIIKRYLLTLPTHSVIKYKRKQDLQIECSILCSYCGASLFYFVSFVADVMNLYYGDDETVQQDEEIQAFIKDICSFGMQDFDYCGKNR